MMKKLFLLVSAAMVTLAVSAQSVMAAAATNGRLDGPVMQTAQLKYGYLSCDSALHALPEYAAAMRNLNGLRGKYAAEMKRVEDEFNSKYELFLEGQHDFAPSIRQKRQAELQELIEKNTAFKKKAQQLLEKATQEALNPLKQTIQAAITRIGQQKGLAFVVNTDGGSLPFINPALGEDITGDVIRASR